MMPNEWAAVAMIMVKDHQKAMFAEADAGADAGYQDDKISRLAAIRLYVGAALVRAGERMQGAQRPAAPLHSAR